MKYEGAYHVTPKESNLVSVLDLCAYSDQYALFHQSESRSWLGLFVKLNEVPPFLPTK